MVEAPGCRFRGRLNLGEAIATFPRDRFDYVWLIDGVPANVPAAGLRVIWRSATGALYRVVVSATTASDTPNGSLRLATQ